MNVYKKLSKIIIKYSTFLLSNVTIHFLKLLLLLALSEIEQTWIGTISQFTEPNKWVLSFPRFSISIIPMTFCPLLIICHGLRNISISHKRYSFSDRCHFSLFHTDLFLVDNTQGLKTIALWKSKTKCLRSQLLLIIPWCQWTCYCPLPPPPIPPTLLPFAWKHFIEWIPSYSVIASER